MRGKFALEWPGPWFGLTYRSVFGQLLRPENIGLGSASSRDPRLRLDLLVTDRSILPGAGESGVGIPLYTSSVSCAASRRTVSACRPSVYRMKSFGRSFHRAAAHRLILWRPRGLP